MVLNLSVQSFLLLKILLVDMSKGAVCLFLAHVHTPKKNTEKKSSVSRQYNVYVVKA